MTVCAGVTLTDDELFAALGNSADEGGVWTLLSNGTYMYSFEATEDCPGSSAYVKVYYYEVTEDIVEDVTVCEGGSYTWSINNMTYDVSDSPVVLDLIDSNGCAYTATLTITETPGLHAGENAEVTVCAGVTLTDEELFAALGNSADEGGVWTLLSNGTYMYSFEATEDCPGSSAYVKVYYYEVTEDIVEAVTICEGGSYTWPVSGMVYTIEDSPVMIELQDDNGCDYVAILKIAETPGLHAGENAEVTVCAGVIPTDEELFAALGNSADEGGVWTLLSNGTYMYSFEATEACPGSSAYVKVYYYDSTEASCNQGNAASQSIKVYPVPAGSNTSVSIELDLVNPDNYLGDIEVVLYDTRGRMIHNPRFYKVISGNNVISYKFGNMEEGTYIMMINGDSWSTTKRLIIK